MSTQTLTRDQRHPSYQRMVQEALEIHAANGTLESPLALRLAALRIDGITISEAPEETGEVFPKSAVRTGNGATGAGNTSKPGGASERQISFATALMHDRQSGKLSNLLRRAGERMVDGGPIDMRTCSDLIGALKALPYRQREVKPAAPVTETPAAPRETVSDGFYKLGDQFVKVQVNLAGTRSYAKAWDGESWVYAAGLLTKLTPEMRLTSEQASEFGALYGRCIAKGCKLTHETSIRLGYGEKCAANNGWYWG